MGVDDADGYHVPESGAGWYGSYSEVTLGFAIGHNELPIPADATEVRFTYTAPDGRAVEQVMLTAGAKTCEDSEPAPKPEITPEPEPVRERPDPPVAVAPPRLAE